MRIIGIKPELCFSFHPQSPENLCSQQCQSEKRYSPNCWTVLLAELFLVRQSMLPELKTSENMCYYLLVLSGVKGAQQQQGQLEQPEAPHLFYLHFYPSPQLIHLCYIGFIIFLHKTWSCHTTISGDPSPYTLLVYSPYHKSESIFKKSTGICCDRYLLIKIRNWCRSSSKWE